MHNEVLNVDESGIIRDNSPSVRRLVVTQCRLEDLLPVRPVNVVRQPVVRQSIDLQTVRDVV